MGTYIDIFSILEYNIMTKGVREGGRLAHTLESIREIVSQHKGSRIYYRAANGRRKMEEKESNANNNESEKSQESYMKYLIFVALLILFVGIIKSVFFNRVKGA